MEINRNFLQENLAKHARHEYKINDFIILLSIHLLNNHHQKIIIYILFMTDY